MIDANKQDIPLYPELRACETPSAERVFAVFNDLTRHQLYRDGELVQTFEAELTPLQQQILDLLGVPALGLQPQLKPPQWGAKSGPRSAERQIHLLEQALHPTRADHLQIVDAVCARGHPGNDRTELPGVSSSAETTRVAPSSTRSATSSDSPACSAKAITGTKPASDTRCSSSNSGVAVDHVCDSFTSSAFWIQDQSGFRHSRFSVREGTSTSAPPHHHNRFAVTPRIEA